MIQLSTGDDDGQNGVASGTRVGFRCSEPSRWLARAVGVTCYNGRFVPDAGPDFPDTISCRDPADCSYSALPALPQHLRARFDVTADSVPHGTDLDVTCSADGASFLPTTRGVVPDATAWAANPAAAALAAFQIRCLDGAFVATHPDQTDPDWSYPAWDQCQMVCQVPEAPAGSGFIRAAETLTAKAVYFPGEKLAFECGSNFTDATTTTANVTSSALASNVTSAALTSVQNTTSTEQPSTATSLTSAVNGSLHKVPFRASRLATGVWRSKLELECREDGVWYLPEAIYGASATLAGKGWPLCVVPPSCGAPPEPPVHTGLKLMSDSAPMNATISVPGEATYACRDDSKVTEVGPRLIMECKADPLNASEAAFVLPGERLFGPFLLYKIHIL